MRFRHRRRTHLPEDQPDRARASGGRTDREKKARKDPNRARASSEPEARERQRAARHAAHHHHHRRRHAAEPACVAPRTHGRAHLPNDAQPRPEQKPERKPGAEAAQRPRRRQQKDDHDETPRAARPRPDPSDDPPLDLAAGSFHRVALKSAICSSVIRNNGAKKTPAFE